VHLQFYLLCLFAREVAVQSGRGCKEWERKNPAKRGRREGRISRRGGGGQDSSETHFHQMFAVSHVAAKRGDLEKGGGGARGRLVGRGFRLRPFSCCVRFSTG